jgi:hypothetical protein
MQGDPILIVEDDFQIKKRSLKRVRFFRIIYFDKKFRVKYVTG